MKKHILLAAMIVSGLVANGQVAPLDALRLSSLPYVTSAALFSQTFYEGSARTSSMGNAFISLGGDIGALSINPASSGVYRYSEFSVTPSIGLYPSQTNYLGTNISDNRQKPGLSSMGYVANIPSLGKGKRSGLTLSFAVNRVNDFNSRFTAKGRTDASSWLGAIASGTNGTPHTELDITSQTDTYPFNIGLPWRNILAWNSNLLDLLPGTTDEYIGATENLDGLDIYIGGPLDQQFTRETMGSQTEILVNLGGRVGTKLFIGANLGIQALNFTDYQRYKESSTNPDNFDTGFRYLDHTYSQSTNGIGLNAKIGIIYLPFAGLRLGATITTPTFLSITENWEEELTSSIRGLSPETATIYSPVGEFSYGLITPMKVGAGLSYVFGKYAIISADVEGISYNMTKLSKSENGQDIFHAENEEIEDNFRFAKNLRVGAEIKPVANFSIRAGYAYYQSAQKNNPNDYRFISAGVGFSSGSGFFVDLSFQHRLANDETLKLYNNYPGVTSPSGTLSSSANKLLMTLGFRF
ncbi:MAG: hypothetical protein BGO30_09050 [Bacteroidetes bacterium 41-46]|nr:MAG: hypothetical protein BGO30_09050 [Bacteroidetes bacterium 41-46]